LKPIVKKYMHPVIRYERFGSGWGWTKGRSGGLLLALLEGRGRKEAKKKRENPIFLSLQVGVGTCVVQI
jgi:hypothetical protein